MPAGNYTVFISVAGERNTDVPSIEDVVKRECKKRIENEKRNTAHTLMNVRAGAMILWLESTA